MSQLIGFIVVIGSVPLLAQSPEQTYVEYKAAIKQGDGEKAARLLSKETLKSYEQTRRAALETSEAKLETLPTLEVIGILSFRHCFTKKELEKNTGTSLLVKAAKSDSKGIRALDDIQIDAINYGNGVATATLKSKGKPIPDVVMVFRKQDGEWKWALDEFSKQAADRFEKMRREQELGKVEFALKLLRIQFGNKVSDAIAKGPRDD